MFVVILQIFIIISALLFCSSTAVHAAILSPELEAVLQSAGPEDEIPVIVHLADKANIGIKDGNKGIKRSKIIKALRDKADSTQRPLKDFLEKRNARGIRQLWIINGIAVTVTPSLIDELKVQPGMESIRPDGTISIPGVTYGEQSPAQWNINAVHAPELWMSGFTGERMVVANLDTGVDYLHPDLNGRWRGGTNSWFNPYAAACAPPAVCSPCDASADIPCDVSGHGTGTMGVMVGGDAGGSYIGVAPGAQWIAAKIFDDSERATYSAIHEGFQWILDPDDNPDSDDAPDVVNISWGFDRNAGECITEFQTDGEILKAAGMAVVNSAGNAGSQSSTSVSPANYPQSFAAGATTVNNIIAFFSSRGPSACDGSVFPEVVAPGVNIKTSTVSNGGLPNYEYVVGTSFSAPHVAGAMALLLSAFPESEVAELEWALKYSALDFGAPGVDNAYGFGLIDLVGAYNAFDTLVPETSFLPLGFDFGSTEAGSRSVPAAFNFTNGSAEDVLIAETALKGHSAHEFLITNDTCAGQVIPTMSACFIEVLFAPLFEGPKGAEIEVSFESAGMPAAHLLLSGNGLLCAVSFQDVPAGYWAERYIENLYCNHITTGCFTEPLMFCPDGLVTRAQAAAFVIRSLFGEDFAYDPVPYFSDGGDSHWAFKYIQKMYGEGISTGYPDGTYKPASAATRAQMASFIIRSLFGEDFTYDPVPHFPDVGDGHWAFKYIQEMFEEGISTGYPDGTYRPETITKRDEMSAVLGRAFLGM